MYAYHGMQFGLIKEGISHECYTMDESRGFYTAREIKVKKSQSGKTCNMRHLIELNLQR